jgi:tetratricopeptide (TPR) repeat protein
MTMAKLNWKPFPHTDADYDYDGGDLEANWDNLHKGDQEPFPSTAWVEKVTASHPGLKTAESAAATAEALQQAWRSYHRGDFADAVERGLAVGPLGSNVANKATNIYATHLEADDKVKLELYQQVMRRAEELQKLAPGLANAFYFHAQAMGRYGQGISIGKALADGLAGKIKTSFDKTLALAAAHADTHIGLGTYNAEIIQKVGGLVGGMTYGVSKDAAEKHFKKAIELNPDSAVARIEYANGLVMLHGRSKMADATRLYKEAAAIEPMDAMERLDVELARSEL